MPSQLIEHVENKNISEFQEEVEKTISAKVVVALESLKEKVAREFFNSEKIEV